MLKRAFLVVLAFVMFCGATGSAWAKERFALVIGNSNYVSGSPLANPVRDAKAFSGLLQTAGFDVTSALDVGRQDMRRAVSDFADKVSSKGKDTVALVYFAGHGVQIDGANYLLPVDVKVTRPSDFALQAVRLSDVMDVINTIPSTTRIVILDACRNNPFEDVIEKSQRGLARVDSAFGKSAAAVPETVAALPGLAAAGSPGAKIPQGLAVVTAPPGSLVVYSTSPGATAADGRGTNSPFTAALVEAAKTPGASIESVLRTIRLSVHKSSNGKQTPWEVTALTEPFSFFPGAEGVQPDLQPQKSEGDWHHELRSLSPEEAYDVVVVQNNVTVYQIFVSLYGDTPYGEIIRALTEHRIEMWSWHEAVSVGTMEAFEAFLERFPDSVLAATAQRLAEKAKLRVRSADNSPSILDLNTAPVVKTVFRNVIKKVNVPGPERIVHVPGPVRVKEVIKTVIKKVPGPVRVKTVIRKVPGPVRIKTIVKIKKVPGPTRIKTVIKKVPGPVRIKTVIRKVRGPVRTVVKRVRVPCRCRGRGRGRVLRLQ